MAEEQEACDDRLLTSSTAVCYLACLSVPWSPVYPCEHTGVAGSDASDGSGGGTATPEARDPAMDMQRALALVSDSYRSRNVLGHRRPRCPVSLSETFFAADSIA